VDTYSRKQIWKFALFIAAILIGVTSLWYTNDLVEELSKEERKKVELWAEATKRIANFDDQNQDFSFIVRVLQDNETVPVIWVDEKDSIIASRNLDSIKSLKIDYLQKQLEIMQEGYEPIEVKLSKDVIHKIYYKDSKLLTKLFYYPFIQLGVIFLFIVVSYLVFSTSRKMEQNQVWVGMSKETAHQLGTPISSLIAWVELLKLKESDEILVREVEKDVKRLETITQRFSKIGAAPVLEAANITEVLFHAIDYIHTRTSDRVAFNLHFSMEYEIFVPVNISLFEWVIENICKNAIDAMNGSGAIDVWVSDHVQVVYIDIKDTGKGIPKSKYKTVFQPGYTTKKRGWGLGLSLAKRIIETYHLGKIFVKNSEINKGTTFRIALKK